MPEIPEEKQENYYWLFQDNQKGIYEFKDFLPAYETRNNKKIPVFVFLGEDKDGRAGEFLLSTWNVSNVEELKKTYGNNSDTWKGKRFSLENVENSTKLKLISFN